MSIEKFDCPLCKNPMKKSKVKFELKVILDDGTKGDLESSFLVCKVCHNIQLMPDLYTKGTTHNLFQE
jgi:hypothetical protein